MTCIEKLKELHPDWSEEMVWDYIQNHCPDSEYILPKPIYCESHGWEDSDDEDCETCWNRQIHEKEGLNVYLTKFCLSGEDMRRVKRIAERVGKSDSEIVADALVFYEDTLNAYMEGLERSVSLEFR